MKNKIKTILAAMVLALTVWMITSCQAEYIEPATEHNHECTDTIWGEIQTEPINPL